VYVIVWEFHVRDGCEHDFETIYGPEGAWTRFFRRGDGYLGTELTRDVEQQNRYLTLDFWASQTDYERFRAQYGREYEALDKKCEELTDKEIAHGSFQTLGASKLRFLPGLKP
jgi:heme-degrading monooxygenase HmoA